ncbi:transposase [Archangium violaceum]|nr:transposase [Archangium violaceum]
MLQNGEHPAGCCHVRQHPAPASTPGRGEDVQNERPAQQPGPIQSRHALLLRFRLRRCLGRCARLFFFRLCLRQGELIHEQALTDAEWSRIQPLLGVRSGPPSKRGDRDFINAVIWRVRTGVQWRDLPERFGNWKTVRLPPATTRRHAASSPPSTSLPCFCG